MTEGNKTISNDDELCQVFNNFFSKIVDELKIPNISNYKIDKTIIHSKIFESLRYFENHPSITNIKIKSFDTNFSFRDTSSFEVIKLIKTLDVKKGSQKSDIPTKIVKQNVDIFGNFICNNFNYCLKKSDFPCVLKHADVILVHKKEIKSDKVNYRPVSILPSLSKIYEKLMYQQLYERFNLILSPKQCGFRKGHSAQHCLMVMLEKFKESRDKGEEFGAFFTGISKAFDYIDHSLLTTKLS